MNLLKPPAIPPDIWHMKTLSHEQIDRHIDTRRLRMCGLAKRYSNISDEVLEAAFVAAVSTPDPDLDRVEAVRAKMRSSLPDASAVAECMLGQVTSRANH